MPEGGAGVLGTGPEVEELKGEAVVAGLIPGGGHVVEGEPDEVGEEKDEAEGEEDEVGEGGFF